MVSEIAINRLRELGAQKVFLQAPEGLKTRIQVIAKSLEKEGFDVFVSCDPCFGACDIRDWEAQALECDAILHVGHTDFGVKSKVPVVYEPYRMEFDLVPLLEKRVGEIWEESIGLVTTSQFLHLIEPAKSFLEKRGKKVFLGTHSRVGTQGQILGCDASAGLEIEKDVDCFLYLGSGKFHPLGLALKTEKNVYWLDFDTGKLKSMEKEKRKLEQVKAWHIEQAKEGKRFGILLTTKKGQMLLGQAERIKKDLESKGKEAWILVMDYITPEKILGLDLDILVNCACPRMDEDFKLFEKPILNPGDVGKV